MELLSRQGFLRCGWKNSLYAPLQILCLLPFQVRIQQLGTFLTASQN